MQLIRFVEFGSGLNSTIHLLRDKLNAVQDHYRFVFEDDAIELPKSSKALKQQSFALLEKRVSRLISDRHYVEYPIAITNAHLTDEFFYRSSDRVACISVADWKKYSTRSLSKGLEFMVAATIIDSKMDTDVHETPSSCPNDFCDDKNEIELALEKCDYCSSCKKAIYAAVERGRLLTGDVAAVYAILDDVAGRKYSFVIMPFKSEYDAIYDSIRNTLESRGYICNRADDISRTVSVVNIILEQIGRASLIVADLTASNPNVFYELGCAHALGKNTILVVEKGQTVPFDTQHRQYVEYERADLQNSLGDRLSQYLV